MSTITKRHIQIMGNLAIMPNVVSLTKDGHLSCRDNFLEIFKNALKIESTEHAEGQIKQLRIYFVYNLHRAPSELSVRLSMSREW